MAERLDYSNAKFRSLYRGALPQQVKHMLERAFASFGTDAFTLKNVWTRPLRADGVPGGSRSSWQGKLERDFFANKSFKQDICCADLAGYVLYQSGQVDWIGAKKNQPWAGNGSVHWAPYYLPTEKNAESVRLIKKGTRITDFFTDAHATKKAYDDWLPGDYLLYTQGVQTRGHPAHDPAHINVYLGEFQEEVEGKLVGPIFELANASLGTGGRNAYVRPYPMNNFQYWLKGGTGIIWHCRVVAIERLFGEMMGPPVRVRAPARDAAASAPLESVWDDARDAGAPFPIGGNRTWHGGIHLREGDHLEGPQVMAFAPGELERVRLAPATSKSGDTSFVLLRHRFDPSTRRVISPGQKEDGKGAKPIPFYSLCMHVAPLPTYLDEAGQARPGAPEEGGTPAWLARLAPQPIPSPRRFLPANAPVALVTWTRDANGAPLPLRLTSKHAETSPVERADYASFAKLSVDGAEHYLLPQRKEDTNFAAWSAKPPAPAPPRGSKLHFYNPETSELIDTGVRLDRTVLLAVANDALDVVQSPDGQRVQSADGRVAVGLLAYDDPGFTLSSGASKPFDWVEEKPASKGADATGTLEFDRKDATLQLDTRGSGEGRYFVEGRSAKLLASKHKLRFRARRAATGATTKLDRAWPELRACALLSEGEVAAENKRLGEHGASFAGQVADRLLADPPTSCLLGVDVRAQDGWRLEDGMLRAVAGRGPEKPLALYPHVSGTGNMRFFPRAPKVAAGEDNLPEGDTPPFFEIVPSDDLTILPLEVWKAAGRQRALVEVRFAVPASEVSDNQAEIERTKQENAAREKVMKRLRAGETIFFGEGSDFTPASRQVSREVIAALGKISAGDAKRGIHFEIFAGENLVDAKIAGADGALTPVPQSLWQVLRDDRPDALSTAASFQRALDLLLKLPGIERRALGSLGLPHDAVAARLPTPDEWLAFCRENQRVLARVIAAHASEWRLDWPKLLDAPDSRFRAMPEAARRELAQALSALRWWTPDVKLEGISGDPVYHFHPLRLIEWLNTGLDVTIGGSDAATVRVQVDGRPEQKLERSPEDGVFRYRAVLDSGRPSLPATLVLEGVPTANPRISDRVVRGAVRRISLATPRVALSRDPDERYVAYAVPVEVRAVSGGSFLLADGNAHMPTSGYSRATFRLDVTYNSALPDKVTLALDPENAPFRLEQWSLSGATAGGKAEGVVAGGKKLDLALAPDSSPADGASARAYSVRVDVVPERKVGASARVVAKVTGGDFGGRTLEAQSGAIETREIREVPGRPDRIEAQGEDVAKLQLYLSQIQSYGLPFYRRSTGAGEYPGEKAPRILIDGKYERSLARALWRFAYYFAPNGDWSLGAVRAVKLDGKKAVEISVPRAELVQPAAAVADRRKTEPDEFPIVDDKLLAEIVRRFRAPLVLPTVKLEVASTALPAAGRFPIQATNGWQGNLTGASAILPESDAITFHITSQEIAEKRLQGDLDVVLELAEASAYRIWEGGRAHASFQVPLRQALREWTLVPSGNVSSKEAENRLVVRDDSGSVLGAIQLTGARDLREKQGDLCRDVALVQLWLSQIPDSRAPKSGIEPLYKRTQRVGKEQRYVVDGKWTADLQKALALFVERFLQATPATFGILVSKVKEQYQAEAP